MLVFVVRICLIIDVRYVCNAVCPTSLRIRVSKVRLLIGVLMG